MKTLRTLMLGSALAGLTFTASAQNTLTNGLVAYYPFNGNAADESGTGNNGTVIGAQLATDRFGKPSAAYSFNGTNQYISIADSPSLNPPSAISLSAWIKPTEPRGQGGIVSKFASAENGTVGQWEMTAQMVSTPSGVQEAFTTDVGFNGDPFNGHGLRVDYVTPQVDGLWHHLMMTYNGSVLLLWRDGKVVASASGGDGTLMVYAQAVDIGRFFHGHMGSASHFAGLIDDIRIYNRALSAAEAAALYAFESAPNPCIPHRATATAQVVNGFIVGITITDPGCGYTNTSPPAVIFRDSTGTGAAATAIVNNDGTVERIQIDTNGRDYTENVRVVIAPPPFLPTLTIGVSRVNVTMSVVLGRRYQLESSANLATWSPIGDPFVAQDDTVTQEFVVQDTGRYFRINEVP